MTPDPYLQDYYCARAAEYEQIYYRDVPERRREIDEQVLRLRELVNGRRVLDLACGTGYWTRVIAETAKEVLATDMSEEMLKQARGKEYRAPVEFLRADMFEYPFERTFDCVTVGFWFSHQPRQLYQQFFDVVKRPLLKDGQIWLIDNNPPAEGPKVESVRIDEYGNNYKRRYLDDGTEFTILKNYFGEEELRNIFQEQFKIRELTYGNCYWSAVLEPGS